MELTVELIALVTAIIMVASWIITQVNVWYQVRKASRKADQSWTKAEAEIQKAITKVELIRNEISENLSSFQQKFVMPDLDGLKAEQSNLINNFYAAVKQDMVNMEEGIKGTAKAVILNQQSQATRALQKELKSMAPEIEAIEGAAIEQLRGAANPQAMMFQQLMAVDVSDEFAEKYPLQAAIVKAGKLGLMNYAQNLNNVQKGTSTAASGYNPGL